MTPLRFYLAVFLAPLLYHATQAAPPKIVYEENAVYGEVNGTKLLADIAYPEGDEPRPAIISVHGGRWRGGHKRDTSTIKVKQWAEFGYFAMSIEYRLVRAAPAPACYQDLQCAIRFVHAHAKKYHVDTNRIFLMGQSAGGHLVSLAATLGDGPFPRTGGWEKASNDFRAAISVAAAYDLPSLSWGKIWTPKVEDIDKARVLASPNNHVSKKSKPILVMHSDNDRSVPIDNALKMVEALKKAGAPHTFHRYPKMGHMQINKEVIDKSLAFIKKISSGESKPSSGSAGGKRPPNVVVIFIDDMGYGDIGPFGAKGYQTPHLDRMAKEGRVFTDFYVTQAVCSASRAGLMTGCYNVRVGILGALGPASKHGINADEVTMAEICKQKGYATACYGKWHLGHHQKFLPMQHGFDDYFGLPYSNDMWPFHPTAGKRFPDLPLIDGNKIVNPKVTGEDQTQLTTQYTEHAVDFINRNKDKPFFLYVPHSMVHVPLYVSDKFKGKSKRGLFGDVVMELDWSVGQIMNTIRKHKLENDTLVIFTADNGPWLSYGDHAGTAGPLREGKGTMFDGGCREPTVMWWPGKIPAGTRTSTPAMTIDLLPTVAHLIDAKLPSHKIDGKNIWPIIAGEEGAESPQEAYFMYYGRQLQAIRAGKWKLHFPHSYRTLNGRKGGTGGKPVRYNQAKIGLALFDLEADVGETKNVADQHPEVVARLKKLAEAAREDLGDGKRQGKGVRPAGRL